MKRYGYSPSKLVQVGKHIDLTYYIVGNMNFPTDWYTLINQNLCPIVSPEEKDFGRQKGSHNVVNASFLSL